MTEPTIRTLTQAKALSALANPLRARIMDALRVDGPLTASQLADRLGQAVGSASHHLKVLSDAGLIEEVPELAKDRRERWWQLISSGYGWRSSELVEAEAVDAALAAEKLQVQRQADRAEAWLDNRESDPGWAEVAFANQDWFRLRPAELQQLSDELLAVLRRWQAASVDDAESRRADPATEPVLIYMRGFPSRP